MRKQLLKKLTVDSGRSYRRGLVLGLTLAEIFLLLLFLLLAIFSYLLSLEEDKWVSLKSIINKQDLPSDTVKNIEESILIMSDSYENYNALSEQFENPAETAKKIVAYNKIKKELKKRGVNIDNPNELNTKLIAMSESEEISKKYKDICGDIDSLEVLLDALHDNKTALDVIDSCPVTNKQAFDKSMPTTLSDADAMINRLRRTNASLSNKLKDITGGRGLVYPPCWSKPQNPNRPAYIYNVSIFDEGINVKIGDNRAGQDLSPLKINGVEPPFETIISGQEFTRKTKGLYNWSVGNECRFFVRLSDKTSATNKLGYKQYLSVVENHFYKYLTKN